MKSFGRFRIRWWWLSLSAALLVACGGGGGSSTASNGNTVPNPDKSASGGQVVEPVVKPADDADARRFLTQATFGPTDADVAALMDKGFGPWIDEQMAKPYEAATHVAFFDARDAALKGATPSSSAGFNEVVQSFWKHALTSDQQLRRRVAFALSEIFVVSGADSCGADHPRGVAGYMDMLAENAFGSYRALLEKVAMHPIMGCYLSALKNQKENVATGRVPDENFAREIMQLFSIGLYQLNADGSYKTDASGNYIETYSQADVAGLAKVFTGFSYDCPDWPSDSCFFWAGKDGVKYDDVWNRPMVPYPQYHSYQSDKVFLGKTISSTTRSDPTTDLTDALDWIALTHPNVGPFIGKQLIQKLVTSNPSSAYVGRVTAAFEKSGRNLGAMVRAILVDPEARDVATALADDADFGKVREPILRLAAFLRAVGVASDSGMYLIDATDDSNTLAQTPLKAPTVFGYFRPGYVYPGGESSGKGLVTPELQLANESSVAGYVNYMFNVLRSGLGRVPSGGRADVQLLFNLNTNNEWYEQAAKADATGLLALVNKKLMYGTMSTALAAEIKDAVESIALDKVLTPAQVRYRLWSAILLTLASPEFIVQK